MTDAVIKPVSAQRLSKSRLDMIEAGGRLCQLLGMPRSTGQIYGLLYLSAKPLTLDEIAEQLAISKASASTGTRQLAGWRAIRQVWVHGDRRDHFEIEPDLGSVLRKTYQELVKPRLTSSQQQIERIATLLNEDFDDGLLSREEHKLCSERLKNFSRLQKKLQALVPFAEKLF